MSLGAIETASAGSHPKPLHPNAVRVLRKRGIDISENRAKQLDEFVTQPFDTVVTLCDRVRKVSAEFRSRPERVHWSVPDPALEGRTDRASYPAFERTAWSRDRASGSGSICSLTIQRGEPHMQNDEIVNVRYMVDDVEESIAFYTKLLGFEVLTQRRAGLCGCEAGQPSFVAVRAAELGRTSDAGRRTAWPGRVEPHSLHSRRHRHRDRTPAPPARRFRNNVVEGPGGRQILLQDPSGNVVEFKGPAPRRPRTGGTRSGARRSRGDGSPPGRALMLL